MSRDKLKGILESVLKKPVVAFDEDGVILDLELMPVPPMPR